MQRDAGRPTGTWGIGQRRVRDALNGQISAGGKHRLALTPVLLPKLPQMGTAWCHRRSIETAGVPAVAKFGDAPPGPGTIATDPDRRSRLLHRAWRDLHVFVLVKSPLVVHHTMGPDITDNPQAFIAQRPTLGKGHFQGAKFFFHPAHSSSKDQTTMGELINGRQRLGHNDGVAIWQNNHTRAQAHRGTTAAR